MFVRKYPLTYCLFSTVGTQYSYWNEKYITDELILFLIFIHIQFLHFVNPSDGKI